MVKYPMVKYPTATNSEVHFKFLFPLFDFRDQNLRRAHFSSSGKDKILFEVSSVVVSGRGVVVGGAVGL